MASNAVKRRDEETSVATTPSNQVPDFLRDQVKQDAGHGVSTKAEDSLVPLIYILDAKSPQCDQNDPRYIPGARAGAIWLRNFSDPIIDGNTGFLFQPCYFSKDWVEWVPRERGGGFVGRFPWNDETEFGQPAVAEQKPHPENPKKMRWMLPNGNEVKETRYHSGYVILEDGRPLPFVIPLSSTGHTVSRNWMFTMMSKRTETGEIIPSYACLYRLTTRQRSNVQGKWYSFEVSDQGFVKSTPDYERGKALFKAFETGEKMADAEDATASDGSAAPAGADDTM